jgi:hypothetical protein
MNISLFFNRNSSLAKTPNYKFQNPSKESCPVRPIPAYKAGLYGLTEDRQLSESNSKPPFIPVHRTGFSGCFNNKTGI